MTDNQQENEKLLSFKEQILRDLEEANKQIVQVEKEYDLPVQEISTPENKEDETEGSLSELEMCIRDSPLPLKSGWIPIRKFSFKNSKKIQACFLSK